MKTTKSGWSTKQFTAPSDVVEFLNELGVEPDAVRIVGGFSGAAPKRPTFFVFYYVGDDVGKDGVAAG